jgi:hypothetical protein
MEIPTLLSKEAGRSASRLVDEMSRLFWMSRAIHVAAELGISDHLDDKPLTAVELAEKTGTNAAALERLLQFLSAYGIFRKTADGSFGHSQLSLVLREDHPDSKRATIRRLEPFYWTSIARMDHTIRTGESAFQHVHGVPYFEYMKGKPEHQRRFDEAMAQISDEDDAAIAAAYDFKKFDKIVDVGGGQGGLLAEILRSAPDSKGVLFDQPHVVKQAARLKESGFSDRYELTGGNFFEAVPDGGDCYIIKGVLHDFDDDQCVTILSNCRKAVHARGHVVIANLDLPLTINGPHHNLTMDIVMMTQLNGRERTQFDWKELFRRSGLEIVEAYPTDVLFTVIDGVPE